MLIYKKKQTLLRLTSFILLISIAVGLCPSAAALTSRSTLTLNGTSARSAILIESTTGRIIYSHNANTRLPMASTTKIMTALVAIESMPANTIVTIPKDAVGIEGSSIYLYEGEELTLEDLLYALLLSSANDAAVAIAIAVGDSIEGFAELMNEKADELGLYKTHFVNPHGLDSEQHYTTASELAKIAAVAMKNDIFRKIVSTKKKTIPLKNSSEVRVLVNHNKMLSLYEGAIGVKTGFTKKSGRCLVSAAERNGVELIAVTLNAPDDWNDHVSMFDYGFSMYESVLLCDKEYYNAPLWIEGGNQEYVMVKNIDTLACSLPKERGEIICTVEIPRFEYAPIKAGEQVGQLVFILRGHNDIAILGKVPLVAEYSVDRIIYKVSPWKKILDIFS